MCNGLDDDCDGQPDENVADMPLWYEDQDGDGYGASGTTLQICDPPDGWVADPGDCDDHASGIHPAAEETCRDYVDQDCDGYSDDYTGDCVGDPGNVAQVGCDGEPGDVANCVEGVAAFLPGGTGYPTVQDAVDAASPGDVVTVCPGTWIENVTQTMSPLTLAGYGTGVSVLDGDGGQVIDMEHGRTLTVVGLDLQNGGGPYGGGLYGSYAEVCLDSVGIFDHAGDPGSTTAVFVHGTGGFTATNVVFAGNEVTERGGALSAIVPTISIADCSFSDNHAGGDGGAANFYDADTIIILRTLFEANEAQGGGGAIRYEATDGTSTLEIVDSSFLTQSAYGGGALEVEGDEPATVEVLGCTFAGNTGTSSSGGAVNLLGSGTHRLRVVGSDFRDNDATRGGAVAWGADEGGTVTIAGSTFDGNSADSDGAALDLSPGYGEPLTVTLTDSVFTRNEGANGSCGAVFLDSRTTLESIDTDWGSGESDNDPDDICGYDWEGVASFTCSAGRCL